MSLAERPLATFGVEHGAGIANSHVGDRVPNGGARKHVGGRRDGWMAQTKKKIGKLPHTIK